MKSSIVRCAEHTARVAFGFAGINLRRAIPVDAPQRVTAAGFDSGAAILSSVESRSQSDMKRNRRRKRRRGSLQQARVNNNGKVERGKDGRFGVNDDGDFIRFFPPFELIRFGQPCRHPFDRVTALVHRLGKRYRSSDRKRLVELGDQNFDSRAMQSKRDAGCEVSASANQNTVIEAHRWDVSLPIAREFDLL